MIPIRRSFGWPRAAAFSQNGSRLVVATQNVVLLFTLPEGRLLFRLPLAAVPYEGYVEEVAISGDGRVVAISGWGGMLCLWQPDREVWHVLNGVMDARRTWIALAPDGRWGLAACNRQDASCRLVAFTPEKNISIVDLPVECRGAWPAQAGASIFVAMGNALECFRSPLERVPPAVPLPSGRLYDCAPEKGLAIVAMDHSAAEVVALDGQRRSRVELPPLTDECRLASQRSEIVVLGKQPGAMLEARRYDLSTGGMRSEVEIDGFLRSFVEPEQGLLFGGTTNGEMRVYDLVSGRLVSCLTAGGFTEACFVPNAEGLAIATSGFDGVYLHRLDGAAGAKLSDSGGEYFDHVVTDDAGRSLVGVNRRGQIRRWDTASGERMSSVQAFDTSIEWNLDINSPPIMALAGGRYALERTHRLRLFDLSREQGRYIGSLSGWEEATSHGRETREDVAAEEDGELDEDEIERWRTPFGFVWCSPDEQEVAWYDTAAGHIGFAPLPPRDGDRSIWELGGAQVLAWDASMRFLAASFPARKARIKSFKELVAFEVRVYDRNSRARLCQFALEGGEVLGLALSPGAELLAMWTRDHVEIHRVQKPRCMLRSDVPQGAQLRSLCMSASFRFVGMLFEDTTREHLLEVRRVADGRLAWSAPLPRPADDARGFPSLEKLSDDGEQAWVAASFGRLQLVSRCSDRSGEVRLDYLALPKGQFIAVGGSGFEASAGAFAHGVIIEKTRVLSDPVPPSCAIFAGALPCDEANAGQAGLRERIADEVSRARRDDRRPILSALVKPDADLSGLDLRACDLTGASLRGGRLRGADLRMASLVDADLSGADLSRARLEGADLRFADLRGANLEGSNLFGASLGWVHLDASATPRSIYRFERRNRRARLFGCALQPCGRTVATLLYPDARWPGDTALPVLVPTAPGEVHAFDVETGGLVWHREVTGIDRLVFAPRGDRLFALGAALVVFDAASGAPHGSIEDFGGIAPARMPGTAPPAVQPFAVSPDGRYFAVASETGDEIRFFDVAELSWCHTELLPLAQETATPQVWRGHGIAVTGDASGGCVRLSWSDAGLLVYQGALWLFSEVNGHLSGGKQIPRRRIVAPRAIEAIELCDDGSILALVDGADVFELNAAGGEVALRGRLRAPRPDYLAAARFLSDGRRVFVSDHLPRLFEIDSGRELVVFEAGRTAFGQATATPNGSVAVAYDEETGFVHVWDTKDAAPRAASSAERLMPSRSFLPLPGANFLTLLSSGPLQASSAATDLLWVKSPTGMIYSLADLPR